MLRSGRAGFTSHDDNNIAHAAGGWKEERIRKETETTGTGRRRDGRRRCERRLSLGGRRGREGVDGLAPQHAPSLQREGGREGGGRCGAGTLAVASADAGRTEGRRRGEDLLSSLRSSSGCSCWREVEAGRTTTSASPRREGAS